jgi:hypothetical protein
MPTKMGQCTAGIIKPNFHSLGKINTLMPVDQRSVVFIFVMRLRALLYKFLIFFLMISIGEGKAAAKRRQRPRVVTKTETESYAYQKGVRYKVFRTSSKLILELDRAGGTQ